MAYLTAPSPDERARRIRVDRYSSRMVTTSRKEAGAHPAIVRCSVLHLPGVWSQIGRIRLTGEKRYRRFCIITGSSRAGVTPPVNYFKLL